MMRKLLAAALVVAAVTAVHAQGNYPSKPIRWVVPYAAGGGSDVIVRPIALRASELLGQAIANLVDNGLKYGTMTRAAPASKPKLRLTARRVEAKIEIAVADQGPGILDSDRNRVLQRFVRLEGSRTQSGSGLGLSLVNAIAHLHKGALHLEDNKPGLRAVLVLPAGQVLS